MKRLQLCAIVLTAVLMFIADAQASVHSHQQCTNHRQDILGVRSCPIDGTIEFSKISTYSVLRESLPNHPSTAEGPPYSNDQPICTPPLAHISDILCIYVYPSFLSNRGIAIITQPSLLHELTQRLHTINTSTTHSPDLNNPTPYLHTTPIPNRGLAATATTTLPPHTRLTHLTPILLLHNGGTQPATPHDRETLIRTAISHLPPPTQALFNALGKSQPHNTAVHAQDIIQTNAFSIDVAGVPHLAIFPEASRYNHDCGPNAMYSVDSVGLTHTVYTTREIAVGEEVTVSYLDVFSSHAWRREELKGSFGFECSCRRCVDEYDESLLGEVREIERVLGSWEVEVDEDTCIGMAERLVELYLEMGLEGFMNTAYGHAALAWNSMGDAAMARGYAEKALKAARVRHGERGARAVRVWEEFLEGGVERHWSWKRRVRT